MNKIAYVMTGIAALSGLVAGIMGCGGSGSSSGGRAGRYVGKLTSVVAWKMADAEFAHLSPVTRATLQQQGMTLDETTKTIVSNELPLQGHWVRIGDRFCMTDKDGLFVVDGNVPDAGTARVFSETDAPTAEGEFPISSLVPEGQTPGSVRLTLDYHASSVTKATSRAQAAPDGCPLKEACLPAHHPDGNDKACRLDYNGPDGDSLPRVRGLGGSDDCVSKSSDNYIDSTCFHWTFAAPGRPCLGEGPDVDEGMTCWKNHKYRNCQNMGEDDLNLTPKIKVPLGGQVTFTLRNNTPANNTMLLWQEKNVPGSLALDPSAPSSEARLEKLSGAQFVYHYNEARQEHYEDVKLVYTAPTSLPDGKTAETYHLEALAGGYRVVCEVVVGEIDHIEVSPVSDSIKVGDVTPLTAVAKDSNGNIVNNVPFEWSSSNPGVATVDAQGLVLGVSEGQSVIHVSTPNAPGLKASATITVTKDEEPSKPGGRYVMESVNDAAPPKVVNEFYDPQLKYTFRSTVFSGVIVLNTDGTFETERKFGEYNAPATLKGSGTYQVTGGTVKFTYTSGTGPGAAALNGPGKIVVYYVLEKDNAHFPKDVPVTEVYRLQ